MLTLDPMDSLDVHVLVDNATDILRSTGLIPDTLDRADT